MALALRVFASLVAAAATSQVSSWVGVAGAKSGHPTGGLESPFFAWALNVTVTGVPGGRGTQTVNAPVRPLPTSSLPIMVQLANPQVDDYAWLDWPCQN